MKKTTYVVLVMTMLAVMLSGCGKKDKDADLSGSISKLTDQAQTEEEPAEVKTPAAEEKAPEIVTEKPEEIVHPYYRINAVTENVEDSDLKVVGSMRREYIHLEEDYVSDYPNLVDSLDGYNNDTRVEADATMSEFSETALGYDVMMDENFADDERSMYCEDSQYISVVRADDKYLSFVVKHDAYWGGAEAYEMFYPYNYDVNTGKPVRVSDVIKDEDAFMEAIRTELGIKYGEDVFDPALPQAELDGYKWCLAPMGINVYYDSDTLHVMGRSSANVCICYSEYSDILNTELRADDEPYVYGFEADEDFKLDVDNDGKPETVSFVPIELEGAASESGEHPGFNLIVDGTEYDNLGDDWFFSSKPYFVHRDDGNYVYGYITGYDEGVFKVLKFDGKKPSLYKKIPEGPYTGNLENIEDTMIEISFPVFTDPYELDEVSYFESKVCGIYNCKDEENTLFEISSVDGRNYIEYMNDYTYAAAEVELLDEKPIISNDNYYFMVRMYAFSTFSFAGDYWGGDGDVCCITAKPDGTLEMSMGAAIMDCKGYTLYPDNNVKCIHPIQELAEANNDAPEIIGSWRINKPTDEGEKCELYFEFRPDGTAYKAIKTPGWPVELYKGIYQIDSDDDGRYILFDSEMLGGGTMPCDEGVRINIDPETGTPELDEDGARIILSKTTPGAYLEDIDIGPCDRADEINENWLEYYSYDDSYKPYDCPPEMINSICDRAQELVGGDACNFVSISQGSEITIIWLCCEKGDTKIYMYYDVATGTYTDMFGNNYKE